MTITNRWAAVTFLLSSLMFAQNARLHYEGLYYNGPYIDLYIGQPPQYVWSDGDEISIRVFSSNAAVKVTKLDSWPGQPLPPIPAYHFIYTEQDFPEVFGTDQYEHSFLKVECLPAAQSIEELPQPQIFVPFDYDSRHPEPENDHHLMEPPFIPGHRMLMLRKAFLWENSEDIGGWHGPYADVKIRPCESQVLQNSEASLAQDRSLWEPFCLDQGAVKELPGPIWAGYAPIWYPDPFDEWVDGPFGCIYSNIAVWDWGTPSLLNPFALGPPIGIIVAEADSPDCFMGKSQSVITPYMEGPILVRIWGFGWLVLENIWVPSSGVEEKVTKGDVYWYGGWDGLYPVNVYGPTSPAVPYENSFGSQFKPFTDPDFFSFHDHPAFFGQAVGLLGGHFPAMTLDRPHTYYAIDRPAVFGH